LVACGGTVILSETSEIYGAEHLLTRRARSRAVAEKLLERIEWWKWYCKNYGEELDNNPSVGNKAGGLTTITEKSLGAVSKGGTTALEAVYEYAEPIEQRGFVFMDSPGFDPASVTGMVASGANLVAFTTGRGSCFGFKPTPSFKIASNSRLFARLPEDMDFNAGQVVEGRTVQEVGRDLFLRLLATASGEMTCSEKLDLGDEEFVPWQVGPVL
ncbi:MAG: UxaA family hydrolase, partial [Planctomycetales bacterium]|nr:UxaA family hydrolase [Planctomycetales bacterium]